MEKSIRSTQVYLREGSLEIVLSIKRGQPRRVGNHSTGGKVSSHKPIKFLCLYLKYSLDWEDKINAIVRKCENLIKIVKCMKHT
jgi:hypothetical protein